MSKKLKKWIIVTVIALAMIFFSLFLMVMNSTFKSYCSHFFYNEGIYQDELDMFEVGALEGKGILDLALEGVFGESK